MNIRRDPRGGRNFEYFSEDPYLTGELGLAWVLGLQSEGVGASVKHFAANDAEDNRMRSSSEVNERALREVHLRPFQRVVTGAQPWTVMCSYNKINGVYAAENHWLLTDVLRNEWGFDGVVVSDWGAVRDRVPSMAAGMDLEMPGDQPDSIAAVVTAVQQGELAEAAVDRAASNVIRLMQRVSKAPAPVLVDFDEHHALAREAAGRSIVLLKNDRDILPLNPGTQVAVIGSFALEPRYQGGGSSRVNAIYVEKPLDEIGLMAGVGKVSYSAGYSTDTREADALLAAAVDAAAESEVAVVFLGLSESEESEGYDREHIDLPDAQLRLLEAVAAAQPNTVVVLSHGGVVDLSQVDHLASAVLAGGLLGEGVGGAIADVLYGAVNPSARLTESIPVRLEDVPAYLNFAGDNSRVFYGEGVFVGYRWYDARRMNVTYPFGHGLSYTTFTYNDLRLIPVEDGIQATVRVSNTGKRSGRCVAQFYAGFPGATFPRAPRELKGFEAMVLAPGESGDVTVLLTYPDLAYWSDEHKEWLVEPGKYEISVGGSSRDLPAVAHIDIAGDRRLAPLAEDSTMAEVLRHPIAGPLVASMMSPMAEEAVGNELGSDLQRMGASLELRQMSAMSGGTFTRTAMTQLLDYANAQTDALDV